MISHSEPWAHAPTAQFPRNVSVTQRAVWTGRFWSTVTTCWFITVHCKACERGCGCLVSFSCFLMISHWKVAEQHADVQQILTLIKADGAIASRNCATQATTPHQLGSDVRSLIALGWCPVTHHMDVVSWSPVGLILNMTPDSDLWPLLLIPVMERRHESSVGAERSSWWFPPTQEDDARAESYWLFYPIPYSHASPPPSPQLTNNWDGLRFLSGQVNKVNSKMMI